MFKDRSRREFLKVSAAAACVAGLPSTGLALARGARAAGGPAVPTPLPLKKGVVLDMAPKHLNYTDRFKMIHEAGFDAVQTYTTSDQHEAEEIKKAAEAAGVRIDSVMNMGHWEWPLSSADPAVVEKSLNAMRTSLHNARFWGCDYVLLVPGVVNAQIGYQDAWTRSQANIRKLVPLAEELKVVIALEEVWNKFLLSPIEFARYVDDFNSPWVKVWFDTGNVLLYGYPQDWIRTLGKRIVELHVKDFKRKEDGYAWVNLGDGDTDWPEVRKALAEIGYVGAVTAELESGDQAYLNDVSKRMDRLVLGA